MPSPNFDTLSIQHSKNIADPVAAAADSGKRWSSAQRSYHINEAIRRWLRKHYLSGLRKELAGKDAGSNWEALGDYVVTSTDNLAAYQIALSALATGAGAHIISAYNVTNTAPIKRMPLRLQPYINGMNSFLTASTSNQYWYSEGDDFHIVGGDATSLVSFYYILRHTDLSADGASDILAPSNSWDQILDLSFKVAMEEVGDSESAAKGLIKEQIVDGEIA